MIDGPGLWWVFLLPLVMENTLNRVWPGRSNGLIGDWGWLAVTASWFLIGFLIAPHINAFTRAARRILPQALTLWIGLSLMIVLLPGSDDVWLNVGGVRPSSTATR